MNAITVSEAIDQAPRRQAALSDAPWVQWGLVAVSVGFIFLFLCLPLAVVLFEAFAKGWGAYRSELTQPDAQAR